MIKFSSDYRSKYHLCDTVSVLYGIRLLSKIYHYYFYFSTIICIDSTWCVQHTHTVADCQPGPRPYLCFIPFGNLKYNTGGHKSPLPRLQGERFFKQGLYIGSGSMGRSV